MTDPPEYTSFREAAINLLIHQDYGDRNRTAFIRSFRDRTVFWNPGDAFATNDELLDPTARHLRNPAIITAFRRIGLSEQAGAGMRAIFGNWQSLGHVPPVIENDKARKAFEPRLLRQELLSDEQRQFRARLGVRLNDRQARVFAMACRNGQVSLTDAKAVTGGTEPEARAVLNALVVDDLLRPLDGGTRYCLPERLRGGLGASMPGQSVSDQVSDGSRDLVSDHVGGVPGRDLVTDHVIRRLTEQQQRIVAACDVPRSLPELMERAGVKHRTHFRRTHLMPLVQGGIVTMTKPDNPRAVNQRYVLTEVGIALRAARIRRGREDEGGSEE